MNTQDHLAGADADPRAEQAPSSALRDAAYDQVDRFLRSNLDDVDYADYSQALDFLYQYPTLSASEELVRDLVQKAKAVAFSNGFDAAYPDKLEALQTLLRAFKQ